MFPQFNGSKTSLIFFLNEVTFFEVHLQLMKWIRWYFKPTFQKAPAGRDESVPEIS